MEEQSDTHENIPPAPAAPETELAQAQARADQLRAVWQEAAALVKRRREEVQAAQRAVKQLTGSLTATTRELADAHTLLVAAEALVPASVENEARHRQTFDRAAALVVNVESEATWWREKLGEYEALTSVSAKRLPGQLAAIEAAAAKARASAEGEHAKLEAQLRGARARLVRLVGEALPTTPETEATL